MYLQAIPQSSLPVFNKLNQFKDFYLAGGTALALQIGHRVSVDFDLFSETEISKSVQLKVKRVFHGMPIHPLVNTKDEYTALIDKVKVTWLYYPFPVKQKLKNYQSLKLLSIPEIAATKAYAIGRRGTFKDYIDLYFIINQKYSTIEKIIKLAEKKFKQEFNSRLFLEQLIYLKDIDDLELVFLKENISKKRLQQFFTARVAKVVL